MKATARIRTKTGRAPPQAKTRSTRVAAAPPARTRTEIRTRAKTRIIITSLAPALKIKIGKRGEVYKRLKKQINLNPTRTLRVFMLLF